MPRFQPSGIVLPTLACVVLATPAAAEEKIRQARSSKLGERLSFVLLALFLLTGFCLGQDINQPAHPATVTVKTVFDFFNTNGASPVGPLVQGADGNLYGATTFGGANCDSVGGCGSVFELAPSGHITTLYSFCSESNCMDGANPSDGMMLASDGNFYGFTPGGGISLDGFGQGVMYQLTPAGNFTAIYLFCSLKNCADGSLPEGTPIEGTDGKFYGLTFANGPDRSNGTFFSITTAGKLTTLYGFCKGFKTGPCLDGVLPFGTLVQGANGNFYGTTSEGGAHGLYTGTIFEITATGQLTRLYSFCSKPDCADGQSPSTGLVQGPDGNFYGVTYTGGAVDFCNNAGCGTIYKITPDGKFTSLYSFCEQSCEQDGWGPAQLVLGSDGNFYGTTFSGGTYDQGTIFKFTPDGHLTSLYSFCEQQTGDCPDGRIPGAELLQAPSGSFYGATRAGGTHDDGVIFRLSTGLAPFVQTIPATGKIGANVSVLGDDLTGSTSVTFDGTAAEFTVVTNFEIEATVPQGASTGSVEVKTPHGTLASDGVFQVVK
jgi:uncharacterized repeat protein (TIGR03803 family)